MRGEIRVNISYGIFYDFNATVTYSKKVKVYYMDSSTEQSSIQPEMDFSTKKV